MNKLRLTFLILSTIGAIAATYIYRPFDLDYSQICILVLVTLIFTVTYLKIRKNVKSKAASSAVRRSAGGAGVRKFDKKMLNFGLIASTAILAALKGYLFLIPIGIIIITYLLYRLFNIRIMALIGYISSILIITGFTFPYISSLSTVYSLLIEGGIVIAFLFVAVPQADLFCIE